MLKTKLNAKKQGAYFIGMTVLFTFLILGYGFAHLTGEYREFSEPVGDKQLRLLQAYDTVERVSLYVDTAGMLAVQQALHELAEHGGTRVECAGKWKGNCKPTLPSLQQQLTARVNRHMQEYLLQLEETKAHAEDISYALTVTDGAIAGVALTYLSHKVPCPEAPDIPLPTEMGGACTVIFYQPSFTALLNYSLLEYQFLWDVAEYYTAAVQSCTAQGTDRSSCLTQASYALQHEAFTFQDCPEPEGTFVWLCAVSKHRLLAFDPITKETSLKPVTYQFAIEVP